ncbi:hypothetical protein PR202_ga27459 [Eleusine coracana subsp. coracana]|uniref:Ubiquitin-like protease family profile domain-containing protein n=1 Tax=Eleusine coracana subsp. coracana TaxID=191504 RepID=A0AAV5DG17_ELECO|nr:hypothetical protein PR202_ga27459 [Eleusine coracana subsp. coracana]
MGSTGGDPEEWILSYCDVVLIRSDLDVLRGPRFINDRIIAFYFAHLSATFAPGDDADLLLLPPSIPYLLSSLPDAASVDAVAEPLRLRSPAASRCSPRGAAPRFVHHDSIRGAPNLPVAHRLAEELGPLLADASGKVPPLVEGPTPGQTNGYDCGVYVMAVARAICGWWSDGRGGGGDWFEAVKREVNAASVTALRAELLELIDRLIQEKANSKAEEGDKGH